MKKKNSYNKPYFSNLMKNFNPWIQNINTFEKDHS